MSVVVVCSNELYCKKTQETLIQIRTNGKWIGDLVWIAIDFEPPLHFVHEWHITVLHKPSYDMFWLSELRCRYPFTDTDGREIHKLIQFSKWRVFSHEFKIYKSLLYIDSGMYINHPIAPVFSIEHQNKFIAPDDRFPFDDPSKTFTRQWDQTVCFSQFQDLQDYCQQELSIDCLDKCGYFLNCLWLMDTSLIKSDTQIELLALLKRFPISRTNEMAIMNLYFLRYWKPLPEKVNGLLLFDWTQRNGHKTDDYIMLKYPRFNL